MAVNLVLSQVVGQAFVVDKNGEVSPAQPNMQLNTGDVISVPKGKNAWLVTEDQEQIDVLDDALLVGEDGVESLNLPSDVIDIIAAIEEGQDPGQVEDSETAAGEVVSDSSWGAQVVIESQQFDSSEEAGIPRFISVMLAEAGLSPLQIDAISNTRYALLANQETDTSDTDSIIDRPATVSGDTQAQLEDNDGDGPITVSGSINISDPDSNNQTTIPNSTIDSAYGTLVLVDGNWVYTLDPDKAKPLAEGEEATDGSSHQVTITVTGKDDAAEVSGDVTASVTDRESVTSASGSITVTDPDNGETATIENTRIEGEYGTFELVDGDWTYVLDPDKAQSLAEDEEAVDSIILTASDGSQHSIDITVTGTDDAAVVTGDTTAVVQDSTDGAATATGSITVTDPDSGETATIDNTSIEGQYGTFNLVDGNWTYTVDREKTQSLAEGEEATDTIALYASDGSQHTIEIAVTGTDDAAVVTGDTTASVQDSTEGATTATGSITVTDPDSGETATIDNTRIERQYGTFNLVDGNWTYTVDREKTQSLAEGEEATDTIALYASDGSQHTIEIAVTGTDDAAVVTGDTTASVQDSTEGATTASVQDSTEGATTATGSITVTDPDNGKTATIDNTSIDGQYGTFELVDGNWTYTVDREKTQSLGEGEERADTITLTASDGSQHQITINVTGTDDVAEISGDTTSAVQDNTNGNAVATGSISVSDPDANDNTTIANTSVQGSYGTLVLVNGNWTYTVDKEAAAPLAEGEQAVDVITLVDSNGDEHQIVMNITGINDPAEVAGEVSSTIVGTEGGLTATGQLSSSDIDGQNNAFVAETVSTLRGELTIDAAGNWTYESTDPTGVIKSLGEGDTLTEVVTVRAADGTEQHIEITFQGVNDEAVFSAISTGTITEGQDGLSAAGSINVVDADAGQSFMQAGDIDGQYGVLTIDAAGNWSYATNDSSLSTINSLTDGEHITDTITVYSLDGSETQITITINGSNDDAVIDGDVTATVVDNGGTLSTSGELSSQDVDGNDNVFVAETVSTPRGEFTINAEGAWTYTSTDPTGAIERLGEGDTLTEVVTVRAEDGTEQQIVFTLEGVNDAPVFSGISTRDVYETNDVISVSGSINTVDPDYGESFMLAGTYLSDFGSVSIDRAGNWTYTSDPNQSSALDALAEGETLVESITVRSVDGTETELLVTIIGTNDPAEIAGDITGTVIESDGTMSTTGSLTSTDVDGTDGAFTAQTIEGRWGELTIAEDGSWTYSTTDEKGAIDRLSEGDHLTDTITVRAEDGTMQSITITIDGTNDAATFGGKQSATINETDGQLSTSGRATVSDADYGEYFFNAGTYTGTYGEVTIDKAGNWTYTTDPSHNDMLNGLNAGDPLADTVTVYSLDGTPMDIVINIVGTDDLPVVSGEVTGDLTDTTSGETLTVSGEISISDVDSDDTPSFDDTRIEGEYGALELVDGAWTYTLYKNAASEIPEGDTDTDTITLTATDGTTQSIVITITGTDDAPELRGHTTGDLDDGGDLTTSGTIEIVDPDSDDNPTLPDATVDGTFGSLDLVDGEWTYTLNPDSVASLNEGDITTDTITIEASDGSTHDIVITITGTDQEPVLQGSTTGTVAEGGLLTATGTVDLVDPDSNDSPTLPNGTIHGQYGSLEMVDGAWTYTLDPELAQYLDEGETATDTISITASDGTVHDIEVTITGSESAAGLSGDLVGNVTDDNASLVASGSLSIDDPDTSDNPTLPDTTQSGQYGTFDMVDGDWTYTLDPELAESLDGGVTVADTITITDSEGGEHTLVINVTGTDDAAVLTGETTGTLTEGSGVVAPSASGTIELVDPDTGDTPTIENTKVDGEFGSLTLTDGEWTYTLNPGAGQSLAEGESTTDTLTLTDSEGNTHDIVITIAGTDDAAVVTGDTSGNTTDQGTTVSGSISISDVDNGENPTISNTTIEGEYGSLTLTDGEWTYTVDPDSAQTLPDGESANDTFTLTASDGSTHQITVTVEGTDDAAVVTGDLSASVAEGGDASVSGSINISDPDAAVQPTLENGTVEGEYGSLTLTDGEWTYTVNPDNAQSLGDGDTATDTITVTASDGSEHQISVTVTGSDDAAVVSGVTSGGIDLGADTPQTSVSGTLSISDVDDGDTPSFDNVSIDGDYGTFTLTDGNWTYTVDPSKADALNDNQTEQEVFTLTASDGTVQQITVDVTGTDDAAVISDDFTASITEDTGAQTASGTITITDVDTGDTPTIPNGTLAGQYGSLTLVDGAWTYTADSASIQSLADGDTATDTITVTASDGTTQDIVITITGTDDAAVVTGDTAGNTTDQGTTVSGSISISDVDNGENPTIDNITIEGEYGSLTLTDGEWTYTVNPDNAQSLGEGDSATDTITVTASDGSEHQISVTVTGSDDAAVVSGVTSGGIDLGADTPQTSVSGTLSITDVDDGDTPSFDNVSIDGDYGTFTLTDGNWTYTVDPSKADALNDNQTEQETFTLTASDGTVQQITVDVTGTDDAAVVSGNFTASITEDTGAQTASGTITITDADTGDTPTIPNGTLTGEYGSLTLVDGAWTYTADSASIQSLADGDTATDTITVTASDGTTQDIVITITGTNDAAVVTGDTTGNTTDQGTTVSGSISISDADNGENPTISNTTIEGEYGSLTLTDGEWTYTVNAESAQTLPDGESANDTFTLTASDGSTHQITVTVEGTDDAAVVTGDLSASVAEGGDASVSGSINISDPDAAVQPTLENGTIEGEYGSLTLTDGEWTYTVNPDNAQSLGDGDSATDTITVTASDGSEHQISVTVTGSDDAAVVSGVTSGGIDLGADTPQTSVSGTLSITDVDDGDTPSFDNVSIDGDYGTFTLTEQEVFTLTASDGTVQQITVDVTGTDDAAVISGDFTASITEDTGAQTASGTITITDADTGDTPTIPNGTLAGQYGSLTLVDGAWTYTVNSEAVQSLGQGETTTDTITVTASDGTTQDIVVSLTGTDDAAQISGTTTGSVTEGNTGDIATASGELSVVDPDGDPVNFPDANISGEYGSLSLVDGEWTYTLDQDAAQSLNQDQQVTDTLTVTASDGTTQDIVVTITGTEDTAVLTGDTSGTISTTDQTIIDTNISRDAGGTWDASGGDSMTLDFSNITSNAGYHNSFGYYVLDAEGNVLRAEIIFDDAHDVNNASANVNTEGGEKVGLFLIPNGDANGFDVGEVTLSFGSNGVTAYQGSASATTLVSESSKNGNGFDYEQNSGNSSSWEDLVGGGDRDFNDVNFTVNATQEQTQDITVNGQISITDADSGDTPTLPNTTVEGDYGSLTLVNGEWTYTLNPDTAINAKEDTVDSIIITASDGSQHEILISIASTDDAPVVSGEFTGRVTEGNAGDNVSVSGTLSISDVDTEDTPEFENTTVEGEYGSLTLTEGEWTYTANQNNIQSLGEGEQATDTITLTATDGTTQDITITITGTNDAAIITGETAASITEDTGAQTASGTITITDVDTGDTPTIPNGTLAGEYGSLTLVDGAWTYTADSASIQSLADGDTATDTITVTASDGTTQDIVITITGTDDAAVVTGDTAGNTTDQGTTVSGSISISDVDNGENPTIDNITIEGEYGSLTLTDGEWTYTVNAENAQTLPDGESANDTFTLTASDGSTHQITVTVEGTDDAAFVTGDLSASVAEGGDASVSGSINISDPDAAVQPTLENGTIEGEYGSLTLTDGEWTYTVNPDNAQSLGEGDSATDTITVTASDGSEHQISVTVTGSDDAAVVSGVTSGGIDLGADTPQTSVSGTLSITDVDDGDTPSFDNVSIDGDYGTFTLTDGNWTYTVDPSKADALNDNQTEQETFTLTASDGTVQQITVDVTGADDAAVITGDSTASITEDTGAQTASGTITITDVDTGDTPTIPNGTLAGEYGSLTLVDGAWTYTADSASIQSLADGDTATDTITVTASDGTTQDIVITITGTDDAAVIEGNTSGAITEDTGAQTASGTITITDADTGETPAIPNGTLAGEYGSLTLVDGAWTYTADSASVQSLADGDTATDTITVTASDGTTQNIDITVSGVDEASEVSGDMTGSISNVEPTFVDTSVSRGSDGTWDASGSDNMTLDFSNITSNAGYHNSFGYYVLDAGGNVLRAEIIFDDAHDVNNASADFNTEGGEKVGLFLIPNGDAKGFDAGEVTLSFGSNGVTAYQGSASATTLVSESSKNGNGFDYESNSGNNSSWEDLVGGGDRDFNDVVFTVNASQDVAQDITTSGSITISDVDEGQTPTLPNTTVEGEYGSLTLVDGEWTYTLDPELAVAAGEESIDTIVITASDGSQHEIVIAIAGTDDAPEVSGVFTGTVNEGDLGDTVSISGSISITDVDSDDTPEFQDTTIQGQYGSLDLVDGVWTYTVDNEKTQELDTGNSVKDTITLTASDGTTQNIEITVQGTDDAPFVVGTNSAAIVAPEPVSNDFIEVNNGFILNEGYSFSGGDMQYYGNEPTLNFNQSGQTIRIYDQDDTLDGDNYRNEYVQDTSQKVEIGGVMYNATYDYQLDYQDSSGNIYSFAVLDVDLDGDGSFRYDSNEQGKMIIQIDGPEITPGMSMDYLRDTPNQGRTMSYDDIAVDTAAAAASVTGQLSLTDVDVGDSPYFANNTVEGSYGSLELVDGSWTYTLNPDSTSHLQHNDVVTEVITLTASDGVTQTDVNITIGGSETALAVNSHSMTSESMSDVISLDDITFTGSDGDDKIAGSDAHDVLLAQAGDDLILGNGGNDILDGGLGNDILVGGEGNDTMAGGAGADTFAFLRGDQGSASEPATDHITDFDTQNDALNLSDLVQTEATESMESYLSLMDDGEGNATLSISSQGDGNVDQKVVFDNMSVENMADAYSVDIAGMTSEQVSSSVIDAMIAQSKVIID
ncbi:VCBS domain-containing protein [Enterovibrio norvegicus]|uniref:VCBS domain-containing protein n=1 Tax=Enterovibrio norvegicus TaxID=188144 RepID=UPI0024B2065A|nr:VCBS domain-containing protein [Enterovibrio norvegicus]